MTAAPVDPPTRRLLDTIELQRVGCELAGSPLYARVLAALATEVRAGGTARDLLAPHAEASVGDAVLLRLLGGLHRRVLTGAAPALAAHYPSAGGREGPGLEAAFLDAVGTHAEALRRDLETGVQTNEPGRSASLLAGFWALAPFGLPLRVLEVGASAGLNLLFDRYRYEQDGWSWGPADSPLVVASPFAAAPPAAAPVEVVDRRGCDLDPVDPGTVEGRTRLRSFVWPDQTGRRTRLDAALAVAAAHPVTVDRADAVAWVRQHLAQPAPGTVTVVAHSIVFQYLAPADQRAFLATVEGAGARATDAAPLAWLRMEPAGDQADVRLTCWPGGHTRRVARSAYHGPPVALDESFRVVRR